MMMTALLAKKLANDAALIRVFYAFLTHNYPRFMEPYAHWESYTQLSDDCLSMPSLKEQYDLLFGDPKPDTAFYIADTEKDYNYIVDYIF